jgi:hypothetical protein
MTMLIDAGLPETRERTRSRQTWARDSKQEGRKPAALLHPRLSEANFSQSRGVAGSAALSVSPLVASIIPDRALSSSKLDGASSNVGSEGRRSRHRTLAHGRNAALSLACLVEYAAEKRQQRMARRSSPSCKKWSPSTVRASRRCKPATRSAATHPVPCSAR